MMSSSRANVRPSFAFTDWRIRIERSSGYRRRFTEYDARSLGCFTYKSPLVSRDAVSCYLRLSFMDFLLASLLLLLMGFRGSNISKVSSSSTNASLARLSCFSHNSV